MNLPSHLQRLWGTLQEYYEQWRTLTEAEGEAIAAARWPQVEQLQAIKARLHVQIEKVGRDLRAGSDGLGAEAGRIESEVRPVIEHLLALEARNAQSVAAQKERLAMQWKELRTAALTLRQVRQSYAPTPPALWQSYS